MKVALALLFVFFLIVLASDCLLILYRLDEYRLYTRPLLMPLLYATLAIETAETTHKRSKVIISVLLLFALAGDILLLSSSLANGDNSYFTGGLLCFLTANLLYIVFFYRIKHFSFKKIAISLIAAALVSACLFWLLDSIMFSLKEHNVYLAGIAYFVTSGVVVVAAANTVTGKRAKKAGWRNFIPGALLFFGSVLVFGLRNFYPFEANVGSLKSLYPILDAITTASYGLGQLLLISGAVKFIKS